VQAKSIWENCYFSLPATYRIRVVGVLDKGWSERLAGMNIKTVKEDNLSPVTTLEGQLKDQAELLGVLNALYNLGITLKYVERLDKQ